MKKILTVLSMLVAVSALVLAASGLASAGTDGPKVCNSGPQSTCVKFYNDGDVIRVWDTDCDGHAAVGQVQIPAEGINDNIWNTAGCGTYVDYSYGTSVAEGSAVYYHACFGIWSTRTVNRCNSPLGGGTA